MSIKNILITGGAGFVPSSIADRLLEDESNRLVLFDNFLTGKKENIPAHPNCTFIEGDANELNQIEPVFKNYKFDYVYHYAATVGVKRTIDNPTMVLDDIKGLRNVVRLSAENRVKRIFYSSSSEVYGEPVEVPQFEETTPLNCKLPYAIVKNIGEQFCKAYQQEQDLDYTCFRFFNTFGPKQSTDFVVSRFIKMALDGDDITINGDGLQTRTFCYIDDNLTACLNCLKEDWTINTVLNIGNDEVITIKDLAKEIIELTGSSSKLIHLPALKAGDMMRRLPDISNMKKLLGGAPMNYKEGLTKMIESNRWQKYIQDRQLVS